jgi:hypothetical protein
MKILVGPILLALTFSALPSARASESADGTKITCLGETSKTFTRRNGQSNALEEIQVAPLVVKGQQVAHGVVNLRTAYKSARTQNFDIEVSLGFSDGHAEKNIKVGTQIGRHYVSTESAITQEASVSIKLDGLHVNCRID